MKRCVFMGDFLAGDRILGVQRYGREILCALDRLIGEQGIQAEFEVLVPEEGTLTAQFSHIRVVRKGHADSRLKRYLWQQLTFPLYARSRAAVGVDMTLALPVWGEHIVAIYDCVHETFPENFAGHQWFSRFYIARVQWITRSRKKHIITTSDESRREIEKYYPAARGRIAVIHSGWEHMERIQADETIFDRIPLAEKGKYFFALGARYKHKNFQWLLKAARKNPDQHFVITGSGDLSGYSEVLDQQKPENVIFTGYLTDGEIKALMQHCRALIQPSFYEGFGIPPLEALSVGAAAIVARASCLPEIYQDSVRYIDPHGEGCDLEALMAQPVGDVRKTLETYTWRHAAEKLLKVIEGYPQR